LFYEIFCVPLGKNPPEAQGPRHPRHLRLRGLRAERVRTADHQLQQREGPAAGHRLGLQAGAGGHRPAGTGMDPGIHTEKTKYRNFETNIPRKRIYRGLSPNFHIHASVSDLNIPTICLTILLEEICRPILGLYKSLTDT
jgi:hypothetical protein